MYTHPAKFSPRMILTFRIVRIFVILAMVIPLALAGGVSTAQADPIPPGSPEAAPTGLIGLDGVIQGTPTGLTCSTLQSKPTTSNTGDKPQSKVWNYDGNWFSVFPTSVSGASLAGTWIWRLDGTSWTEVLRISSRTDTQADVKISGDLAHILLYSTEPEFITVEYASNAYHFWETYPDLIFLTLTGSRTATIDKDSTGRLWLTSHDVLGNLFVRYSDTPYSIWSDPITIESGIQSMDIEAVIALPNNTIGVMWSNQNTKRFGFKFHNDVDDPTVWSEDEAPGATTAHDTVGLGIADDHINFAVASDSTLYAAIKTGYDTAGYPKIGLLVRRPNGVWDNDAIYTIDDQGSRPIVLLNEAEGILTVFYTSSEGYYSILYKQSSTDPISFGPRTTLATNSFNNASSMKTNYTDELVVIYSSSSEVDGNYCIPTPATGADLVILKTDHEVSTRPGNTVTYTVTAVNNGPDAVTDATVTDTLPAALINASWSCAGTGGASCTASGTGSINELVDLPAGDAVVFTITAQVDPAATGTIENTAAISPPAEVTDPLTTNNSATDTDRIVTPGLSCEANPALVGCWQMEENGGIDLVDGSSYINDGELFDGPSWAAGKVGSYALNLNGFSQFGLVPDDPSLDLTNQLTLTAWIKPEDNTNQVVIKKALGSVSDGYELSLASLQTEPLNKKVFFRINRAASGDTLRLNSTSYYPMDGLTWMHIAATFDGTTMRLYVNGALENSLDVPPGTLIGSNNVPLSIGAEYSATRYFDGLLDDVRVYNTALSQVEIQSLYGNHLPVANDDAYSTAEDTPLDVAVLDGVLKNDTDLDADPLTAILVGNPAHGALGLNTDGSFSYTPDENWNGTDAFTYKANDGKDNGNIATVTITVNPVNDPPVLNSIGNQTVDEGILLSFTATATDPDLQTLTFSLANGTSGLVPAGASITPEGAFTWTPTVDQGPGSYTFDVCVSDGLLSDCETITVTVNEVNVAPVLDPIGLKSVDELVLLSFNVTATDINQPPQTLTFSLADGIPPGSVPTGASITSVGAFTWTPTEAQGPGDYTFDVCVSDGLLSDCDPVTVTVNEVNLAPALDPIGSQSVAEHSQLTINATATDTDLPAQTLTFSLANGTTGLVPANASITPAGVFTWTPTEEQGPGLFTFDVCVSDSLLSDCETITVTVTEVNVAPELGAIGNKSVVDLATLTFTAIATDADLPANILTYSLVGAPTGAAIDPSTGAFSWTPTSLQVGDHTFTVKVCDNAAVSLCDEEQITVTVIPTLGITSLELQQSVDQTEWTDVYGTLASGYKMGLDPALEFEYLDVKALTANRALANGLNPFYLDTTNLPAGFYEYWAAKGVTALATGWQGHMWDIINGAEAMFYLKVSGSTYSLIDGLLWDFFSTEGYLRISGDYPLGAYTFEGTIESSIGDTSPVTAHMTFEALPHLTSLTLRQSLDKTTWTDVFGSLAAYKMDLNGDPLQFEYLDVKTITTNKDLKIGLHPFYLDTASLPAGYYAYWAAKGVTALATGWEGWMYKIITGVEPMFYLKVSAGPTYKLIDGLVWDYFKLEEYLRVSGDYPLGMYTFNGILEDQILETSPLTASITFEALPEISALTLQESVDKSTWAPLTGNLASGYEMKLDLTQTFQYIDVASLTANKSLKDGLHPFYLNTTDLPAGFYEYWDAKLVNSSAAAGTWQAWMWQIINGEQPMFYLKVSGSTYKLVDGLQWDFGSVEEFLRVSGDYPLGTYTFDGVITDQNNESSTLSASITFTRLNHAPVANPQSVTTPLNTAVIITLTASDVENDPLTWTIVDGPINGVLTGTAPNLTYTPGADYFGPDSFTFKVWDGHEFSSIVTVTITVLPPPTYYQYLPIIMRQTGN